MEVSESWVLTDGVLGGEETSRNARNSMSGYKTGLEDQRSGHKTLASCCKKASLPQLPPLSDYTTFPTPLKGNSQDFLGNVGGGDQHYLGSSPDSLHLRLGQKTSRGG